MSLNALPLEVHHMILRNIERDCIPSNAPAAQRLKIILPLSHVTRTFREAVLDYHTFWSTIFLQWPAETVQHFLEQARRHPHPELHVILDPHAAGSANKKENHNRWARFLREEMADIHTLKVKIYVNHRSPALAATLRDTPAPRLIDFELDLDEKQTQNSHIRWLFHNNAPNLTTARIHASAPIPELPFFPSLVKLAYRVTEHNFADLLNMLQQMHRFKFISLKGALRWDPSPLPIHNHAFHTPVVLQSCNWLFIRGMTAHRTRYILSNVISPALNYLDIHERMAEHNNGLLATIFETLPRMPKGPQIEATEPRDQLVFLINSKSLVIRMRGYSFETDWTNFAFADLDDNAGFHILFALIVNVIRAPAQILLVQPVHLHVENSITAHQHVGLSLGINIVDLLLGHIFHAYPLIPMLSFSGNTTPMTHALQTRYPHSLPNLASLRLETSPRADIAVTHNRASLSALKRTRHLRIENRLRLR
ncbi:hypothetical protein SISSUDRAFT_1133527 [Sistotremastrum suecicum HHB10207 ss-3]|uniref:F-box domain-containing protein n=1 Tax=Sistotremastrum suecicum HHB10207 ss-3 TaxID=1314776 RepID=A0A165X0M5_9AGAM|nr:hypothetical protein SISSUDRAFT_1133527 [Sistotremastrum suecicum HHB10207 ss-3]